LNCPRLHKITSSKHKQVLIYYPVSPVHIRNLGILAEKLESWIFRVIYNPNYEWFSSDKIAQYPFNCIPFVNDKPPEDLWTSDVRAVIMSTAQVRRQPFNLVKSALLRGIPTIAIEEVHQLALHDNRINNYMLPVDELLVASEKEREGFIDLGVPAKNVHSIGWPFDSRLIKNKPIKDRHELLHRLSIEEGRPVATLTLLMSSHFDSISIETDEIRRKLLSIVSEGLPSNYQLLVKGHPAEDHKGIREFIKKYAPRARLVDRYVDIQDVLSITDVLFNQGHSQVVVEALLRKLPVIIVPVDINTIFDGMPKDLIIHKPHDIPRALSVLDNDPMAAYASFIQTHLSIPPKKALEFTVRLITDIANMRSVREPVEKLRELMLWEACFINRNQSNDTLEVIRKNVGNDDLELSLERLVKCNANRDDIIKLLSWAGKSFKSHAIQNLWIDTMLKHDLKPEKEDFQLLMDFPPVMMGILFLSNAFRWRNHLLNHNQKHAAEMLYNRLVNDFSYMNSRRKYFGEFSLLKGRIDLLSKRLTAATIIFLANKVSYYAINPWHCTKRIIELIKA
jgi:hypothetical protein